MFMRLIRRRRSRRERLMRKVEDLRKRAPSMPELPELPDRPELPELHMPRRLTRDTRGDTPRLSFAGGVLLGLLVGIVVAGILLNRRDEDAVERRRPTGITLLPHRRGEEAQPASSRSSAVTG